VVVTYPSDPKGRKTIAPLKEERDAIEKTLSQQLPVAKKENHRRRKHIKKKSRHPRSQDQRHAFRFNSREGQKK